MKRTNRSRGARRASTADASQGLRDSAQKIWLAGLGALERARTEGPRMFESLVEQGRDMGARAVGMADEALKTMRQADYSSRGKDTFDQLAQQVQTLGETMRRFMAGAATAGAEAAGEGKKRARRAPSAASKAARRRRAKAPAAGTRGAAATARKGGVRKARKASRGPRARG